MMLFVLFKEKLCDNSYRKYELDVNSFSSKHLRGSVTLSRIVTLSKCFAFLLGEQILSFFGRGPCAGKQIRINSKRHD